MPRRTHSRRTRPQAPSLGVGDRDDWNANALSDSLRNEWQRTRPSGRYRQTRHGRPTRKAV